MRKEESNQLFIKQLQIIHISQTIMPVLVILGGSWLLKKNKPNQDSDFFKMMMIIANIILAGSVAAINFFLKTLVNVDREIGLSEKLQAYRSFFILKCAMIEAPALFMAVIYFITGYKVAAFEALIVIFFLALQRPSLEKIASTLRLGYDEKEKLLQ